MPNNLFFFNDSSSHEEIKSIINLNSDWKWIFLNSSDYAKNLTNLLKNWEIHFIVLIHIDEFFINRIKTRFPLSPLIYYAPKLNSSTLQQLYRLGIQHCAIGDGRQIALINFLQQLWPEHWKKVPENLYPKQKTQFVKKVINFIEDQPLKFFNIKCMSNRFQLTEYQFRELFRRDFHLNFRRFKQSILDHYESILLFEKKLTPGRIYPILNYRNLSAFSRSFRLRHGTSWQNVVRIQQVE